MSPRRSPRSSASWSASPRPRRRRSPSVSRTPATIRRSRSTDRVSYFHVAIIHADGYVLPFYTGDLEPGEIGSMATLVAKRMQTEPRGWVLTIAQIDPGDLVEE